MKRATALAVTILLLAAVFAGCGAKTPVPDGQSEAFFVTETTSTAPNETASLSLADTTANKTATVSTASTTVTTTVTTTVETTTTAVTTTRPATTTRTVTTTKPVTTTRAVITTAPTTKWTPPPTTAQPKPTTPAYVPNNYNWTKAPGLGDDYLINILLIGDDSRSTDGRSRSDTIMLLSINPNTNKASLITFMRDMYVPIHDGYGSSRINHAYEAGGVGFLTECLQMNFGLHIDGVVRINFWGFVKAVDILGGVDVSMTENEVKMMKAYYVDYSGKGLNESMIHTGNCHFDGNAALAYCRIRRRCSTRSRIPMPVRCRIWQTAF